MSQQSRRQRAEEKRRQEEKKREARFERVAWVIAISVVGFWFWFWLYPGYEIGYTNPNKNHPKSLATVVQLGPIRGDSAASAYRQVKLSYKNFNGQRLTSTVLMPYSVANHVGQKEPIVTNRDGSVWIYDNWTTKPDGTKAQGENPRTGHQHLSKAALIVFPVWMFLAYFVWVISISLLWLGDWLCRDILKGLPGRLAKAIRRNLRRITDDVKLRWDFYRRRKRIKPSVAYKMVRRFQAELARMDPTPQVVNARRRANELLTTVLVRDNEPRLEVINGTIKGIREEVEMDIKARRDAHKELAQ